MQQPSESGKPTHQSIGEAVLGNHVDVVEYLITVDEIEAHLQYRNSCGENVLHFASWLCNPDMFRLLIPRFEEGIHQADGQGYTALTRIIASSSCPQSQYKSARILLLHSSAEWSNHYNGHQDPLRTAVQSSDLDMCYLLICIGNLNPVTALSWNSEGQLVLKDRSPENKENMLQILQLLCSHADIASMWGQH